MNQKASAINIHDYSPDFAAEIADLFHRAVHAVDPNIYTRAQQEVWAPTPPDYPDLDRATRP